MYKDKRKRSAYQLEWRRRRRERYMGCDVLAALWLERYIGRKLEWWELEYFVE